MIQRADVEAAQAARCGHPLFLIDIAVLRDIAEDTGRVCAVFLYDLDDVKKVAEAILEHEIRDSLDWRRSLEEVPLLVEPRRRADEIRKSEIVKARRRLGPLKQEQESALEALGHDVELKVITTTRDRLPDHRLQSVGGKGAFLKGIEEATLGGEVDLAVHSLKDVPTVLPPGFSRRVFRPRGGGADRGPQAGGYRAHDRGRGPRGPHGRPGGGDHRDGGRAHRRRRARARPFAGRAGRGGGL